MMCDYIHFFDTTLRDGQQTAGVNFSLEDKKIIASALDQLGIDYIEGGWPGSNPIDSEFFNSHLPLDNSKLVAFGMTRRAGRSADNDPALQDLINADGNIACIVGKSWSYHVDHALEIPRDENLAMIDSSIRYITNQGKEAFFDAEHFFDGYLNDRAYAIDVVKTAFEAGARFIVLCDTNGGCIPSQIYNITKEIAQIIPNEQLGIHTHNDTDNAVSNTLAAVEAGARHVQGTINGLGERCGNANIISLLANLILKMGFSSAIKKENLTQLRHLSLLLDERLNNIPNARQPFVGKSAFAHKGGLHVSAINKDSKTYEHIDPALVGNQRDILVSRQSGQANIRATLDEFNIQIKDKKTISNLLEKIKEKESLGFSYEDAKASLELLIRSELGQIDESFILERFRVLDERRRNVKGTFTIESSAIVTISIKDDEYHELALGNGPVHALDQAFRKVLEPHFDAISSLELLDFKVRIIPASRDNAGNGGTDAVTRVVISFKNKKGNIWSTVGVSTNIIDASARALRDGYYYAINIVK